MKNTKKLVSIMLALVMVLAMAIPVFAAETTTGSITIENPTDGATYSIYKMFNLVSYDEANNKYSYTVMPEWEEFVTTGEGNAYFKLEEGLVKMKDGVTVANDSDEAAALAKKALAYAESKTIAPAATLPNETTEKYTAKDLSLGYYLVDSSLGALCGLTTTKPTAKVKEKNDSPTVDKKVEVSEGTFDTKNTANIGDTVNFKTTITVKGNRTNYVLHDKMDEALSLSNNETNKITVTVGGTDVTDGDTTYTVSYSPADNDTFDITFADDYIAGLAEGTEIVVNYSATLTAAAVAGNANINDTYLAFGDNFKTTHSKTETYTYSFDLVKTDKDNKVLEGAKFELYNDEVDGYKIELVMVSDGQYRVATAEDKNAEGFTSAVIEAGKATITGLAKGIYWLEETEQPKGYNKLTKRVKVEITDANLDATYTDETETVYASGGVQVKNYTGTELPSTGGIGTMIFYIVGGILLVGAGVLLVVRKRMSAEKKTK